VGASGMMSIAAATLPKLSYHPTKTFIPLSMIANFPLIMVVPVNNPAKTVKELVDWAKAHPDKANYAASAAPFQLAAELFKQKTGTNFQHIAYKGSNESVNAAATGEVTMTLADPPPVVGQYKAGRVRALAITTPERHPAWPGVPTMREMGFPELDIALWTGLLVPAGTPAAIIKRLNEEVVKALKQPEVRERIIALGIDPVGSTPEEFSRVIAADIAKWTAVAKAANIKAD
jgi:tripartite-type tricarboxylate transporter receptor subunit TctC